MVKPPIWSKTMEEVLHSINQVLTSMGLIQRDDSVVPSMKNGKERSEKVAAARAELEEVLITKGGNGELLTKSRKAVLALSPAQLLQKLKDGSLSAVSVLEAFQAKAIEESKRTNCITEFIPDAKKWAESLDAIKFGHSSDVQLPLHGFPVSIKDNISVAGMDNTLGLRKKVGQPAETDAVIVQTLKKLGAVPFVKTNVAQMCLSYGCSNPLWGETVNPHDLGRTSGGSSGGEGALIAGGGSFLGIGGDIGGSVRVPASFCGIVGLKPTARRMSNKGTCSCLPGIVGIFGTSGIMGLDSSIVVEATKALLQADMTQFDCEVPSLPWREALFSGYTKKSLRFGWYDYDGIVPPTPGVKRAVAEAVATLRSLGHEPVPFTPPDMKCALQLFTDLFFADQGNSVYQLMKGEELDPSLNFYKQFSSIPAHVGALAKPIMKHQFGENYSESYIGSAGSCYQLWTRNTQRTAYVNQFLKSWKKEELDVLLCPVFPVPAPKKELLPKITGITLYSALYNLLDFPCAALPVTKETEDDQQRLQEYVTSDYSHELLKESTMGAVGMPLGVQIVALPYCEEVLCRALQQLSTAVNFKI